MGMKKDDILFQCLRSALWKQPLTEGAIRNKDDYDALMAKAHKQAVPGMVTKAFMDNNTPLGLQITSEVFSMSRNVARRNHILDGEVMALCELLDAHDVKYVVVKGQTLNAVYPAQGVRSPGDIDFYCDGENFDRAKDIISKNWNVEFDVNESEQHQAFSHHGVEFEMHFNLIIFFSRGIQNFWNGLLKERTEAFVDIRDTRVPTLEPTLNVLYTFMHLYHHFVELGVGLRQFCDLAVLLHTYRKEIDGDRLNAWLKGMDYLRAFAAVEWILVDVLGMDAEDCQVAVSERDKRYEKAMMEVVLSGGNFGFYARKNKTRSGKAYFIESAFKKLSLYFRFFPLSKRETTAMLLKEFPTKVYMAVTGKI